MSDFLRIYIPVLAKTIDTRTAAIRIFSSKDAKKESGEGRELYCIYKRYSKIAWETRKIIAKKRTSGAWAWCK